MTTEPRSDPGAESLPGAEPGPNRVDVAVVGAGIAGLHTALRLRRAGRSVVVLEASHRIGGRLRSVQVGGTGVDLGATWFWPGERRVQSLVEELAIATHRQHRAGDALYEDPRGVQRLQGNPVDVESMRFTEGAEGLARAVAERLAPGTVRREAPVAGLVQHGNAITVVGPSGGGAPVPLFEATHVVLAVAPAQAARITVTPPLAPPMQTLLTKTPVWMGATTKVVVRYQRPFWRESGLAGAAISHVGPLREVHDMSGPDGAPAALFGFASPPPGGRVEPATVGAQLRRLFGEAGPEPLEIRIADWRDEPWISPPGVERLQRYELFGHPAFAGPHLDGRLHFASTETAGEAPGHIEGALAASERVVAAIVGG